MKESFFNTIIYSSCNEDSESERKALRLTTKDTVLCLTGSGARPLDLLIDNPKKIISIDLNATQNHFLYLKIAAYKSLTYPEFKSFIGLDSSFSRSELYKKVAYYLPLEVKTYWNQNYKMIQNGLLYSGRWELFLRRILRAAFFRRNKITTLMECKTLETQKEYWTKNWNNFSWQFFLKIITNKYLWKKIIREPGALLIPQEFDVYSYINSRFNYLANNHLLRTNHFANLLFYGEYRNDCILPIHLREENFETIKSQVDKIEVITDSLLNILDQKHITEVVTAYSLSDFSSYSEPKMYGDIWNRIVKHSNPNTKFCERHFLVKREPDKFNKLITRDFVLEEKLNNEDISFIYTFCAGIINNDTTQPYEIK